MNRALFQFREARFVAQSFTLPYRKVLLCRGGDRRTGFEICTRLGVSLVVPTASRRYSRLKICVTLSPGTLPHS
jgi:hypothetical protein